MDGLNFENRTSEPTKECKSVRISLFTWKSFQREIVADAFSVFEILRVAIMFGSLKDSDSLLSKQRAEAVF